MKVQVRARDVPPAEHQRSSADTDGVWFTPREQALVRRLVAIIVPSDDTGPGALDAGVDRTLDHVVASSSVRQVIYRRGLAAFERLAYRTAGRSALDLSADELLRLVHQIANPPRRGRPGRVGRLVSRIRSRLTGTGAAQRCFQRLVRDTQDLFYSSDVAWRWLGYEGPPFPPQREVGQ